MNARRQCCRRRPTSSSSEVSEPARRTCALRRNSTRRCRNILSQQFLRLRGRRDGAPRVSRASHALLVQRALDRLAPDGAAAGQADAIGGEHACQRVQQYLIDAECFGDRARVLARRRRRNTATRDVPDPAP